MSRNRASHRADLVRVDDRTLKTTGTWLARCICGWSNTETSLGKGWAISAYNGHLRSLNVSTDYATQMQGSWRKYRTYQERKSSE